MMDANWVRWMVAVKCRSSSNVLYPLIGYTYLAAVSPYDQGRVEAAQEVDSD